MPLIVPANLQAQTAQLHNTAGLAKYYQGKYDEAFSEFVKALRKDPSYAAPHYNIGRIYEKKQRFEEALKQYQQTLQLDPRHKGAREAVERLGYVVAPPREEPSRQSVGRARKADLERQRRLIGRLIGDGRLDKAEERLLILLRGHPSDGTLHNLLARVYERRGDYAKAISELRKAEKYLPSSSIVAYRLAVALYRIGAFDQSKDKAMAVVKMDPANYRAYHLLGLIYENKDMMGEAYKYYSEAARLNPSDVRVQDSLKKANSRVGLFHYNAGLFYFTQRNWRKAREELDLALKQGNLNPGQIAIAQQYLIIADFSAKKIDDELNRLESDRRNAELGYVRKRLTFEEVEKSPNIWKQGAYIEFVGRVVSVARNRRSIIVDVDEENEYRHDAEMKTWFLAKLPRKLPDDPRVIYDAVATVQGKLSKPRFLRNRYNRLYSRQPQPVVEVTYLRLEKEDELSGPLKIDYLSYSKEQREQKFTGGQSRWRKYRYR